ncbi:MAG: hypothetical protein AAF514_23390, partial [Verrucomicrobiota bacterium]
MPPFETLIRAVAFDLDNTLIDRDDAFLRWVTDSLRSLRNNSERLTREILDLDQHGQGPRTDVFDCLARHLPA